MMSGMVTVSSCARAKSEPASKQREDEFPGRFMLEFQDSFNFSPTPRLPCASSINSRMRRASAFLWPWLASGSLPPLGFDQDVRPDDSRLDMDGRDLGDADADLVLAEPRAFVPDDRLVRHLDDGGEKKIAARPPARLEPNCPSTTSA
jgi:hypothetical protein